MSETMCVGCFRRVFAVLCRLNLPFWLKKDVFQYLGLYLFYLFVLLYLRIDSLQKREIQRGKISFKGSHINILMRFGFLTDLPKLYSCNAWIKRTEHRKKELQEKTDNRCYLL